MPLWQTKTRLSCTAVVYRLNQPHLPISYSCKLNNSELQTKVKYENKSNTLTRINEPQTEEVHGDQDYSCCIGGHISIRRTTILRSCLIISMWSQFETVTINWRNYDRLGWKQIIIMQHDGKMNVLYKEITIVFFFHYITLLPKIFLWKLQREIRKNAEQKQRRNGIMNQCNWTFHERLESISKPKNNEMRSSATVNVHKKLFSSKFRSWKWTSS